MPVRSLWSRRCGSKRAGEVVAQCGWIASAAVVLAAAYFGLGVLWLRSAAGVGAVAYDFYGQFDPYAVHAWRSLRDGSDSGGTCIRTAGRPRALSSVAPAPSTDAHWAF